MRLIFCNIILLQSKFIVTTAFSWYDGLSYANKAGMENPVSGMKGFDFLDILLLPQNQMTSFLALPLVGNISVKADVHRLLKASLAKFFAFMEVFF